MVNVLVAPVSISRAPVSPARRRHLPLLKVLEPGARGLSSFHGGSSAQTTPLPLRTTRPLVTLTRVDPATMLALALDPSRILLRQGLTPDRWQRELLLSTRRQILLNSSRQAGKSTTTAALAVHTALFRRKSLTLGLRREGGRPAGAADASSPGREGLPSGGRTVGPPCSKRAARGGVKLGPKAERPPPGPPRSPAITN
jgi:hypothetical protein